MKTDIELKQLLVKMLPEKLIILQDALCWRHDAQENKGGFSRQVLDTELLHLCWLVEETLSELEQIHYCNETCYDVDNTTYIWSGVHASWQQRVTALAKVKGIEI